MNECPRERSEAQRSSARLRRKYPTDHCHAHVWSPPNRHRSTRSVSHGATKKTRKRGLISDNHTRGTHEACSPESAAKGRTSVRLRLEPVVHSVGDQVFGNLDHPCTRLERDDARRVTGQHRIPEGLVLRHERFLALERVAGHIAL